MSEPQRQSDAPPAQPASPAFGGRIRELRRKANLTLQTVADQAGISVGFLSQVERDKATPSLGTLAGIASTLGVEIEVFINTPRPDDSLSLSSQRPRFAIADTSLGYERLTTSLVGGTLTSLIVHIPEGYSSEVNSHSGEETIFILEGRVRQTLADKTFDLGPGDNMHFMGDTPHSFSNIGTGVARMLWTGTTPRLYGRPPAAK